MKTDDLIAMLATGPATVDRADDARRSAAQLALGAVSVLVLMGIIFGVRADLGQTAMLPMFSFKLAFAAALATAGAWALHRLSSPGSPTRRLPLAIAAPVLVVWTVAALALLTTQRQTWPSQLLGTTWAQCPLNIALLSAPALWISLHSLQNAAPTNLRAAGAAAGVFSGGVATFAYAWHCPETAAPFMALWYVLGIAVPTVAGALLGPRVLRW